jgi:rhamnosyltransferase
VTSDGLLASVVIRSKDEAADIGRTLELLRGQTIAARAEVIVVDSGSSDATVSIARSAGARVIEIPAAGFSYGGALNTGSQLAQAPLVVALSAHAFPPDHRWLERMVDAFAAGDRLACACGYETAPDGGRLEHAIVQDAAFARRHPRWGYSNASGGFRTELWRQRPFREDLPASEDKEWALHWLERGWRCLVDPALAVHHDHGGESAALTYQRAFREWESLPMYADAPAYGAVTLAREWWRGDPAWPSPGRARVSWRRAAKLAGKYRGLRSGSARAARG